MHEVRMHKISNCEKYYDTWCRTCAFAAANAETLTECNLRNSCSECACYNKEKGYCHCHDEAEDGYTCRYYKENGR